jgi:hypothetical protein
MRPCLIDGVLPTKAVHLLGGSPGAGKTRFSFGLLEQWLSGKPFLGHDSITVPYCFISLDRPRASVEETLETMGLRDVITRLVCLNELPKERSFKSVMDTACSKYPDSQLICTEGFQLFAGDFINRYRPVADLLTQSSSWCEAKDKTILGVCHASKTKEGAKFTKGRDRIGGTVAWSAYSETIIIVDADEETKIRTVDIYPRNAPEEKHQMMMTVGGVLIPCPKEKGEQLFVHILAVREGDRFERQWLMSIAESTGVGEKTVDRAIKKAVEEHQAEPVSDGVYKRTYTV